MKFRYYNMIKNILIGSAAATFYNLGIVDNVSLVKEVFGTVAIFLAMVMLLRDADQAFIKARKEAKKEAKQAEILAKEKSA